MSDIYNAGDPGRENAERQAAGRDYPGREYAGGQYAEPEYARRDDADNPLRMLGQAAWQALMLIGLAAIAVG